MSLNQLFSKALCARMSIVSSKGTFKCTLQFDGALYEQTDGVAMGSPLGPMVFMCSIEGSLKSQGKLLDFTAAT